MNEVRLIDANALRCEIDCCSFETGYDGEKVLEIIAEAPTVKAVPVDEILRVIAGHSNYHGDNILSALICIAEGKKVNPVRPLEKVDAVEVVHAEWIDIRFDPMWRSMLATCLHCNVRGEVRVKSNECGFAIPDSDYCPKCGAKMDGDGNG